MCIGGISLNLEQLLDELGYAQSPNYRSTSEPSQEPSTEHLFRAARKAGVQGTYLFQTSPPDQKTLPPRPAVYVAEAKTRDEAREIHRRLWNLGNAPFLIILLPNEIRVYTGFNFSSRNKEQGLVKEIEGIVDLTFENIRDQIIDFKAGSIDSGKLWEAQSKNITPEKGVHTHLLNNLRKLEEQLKDRGLSLQVSHALIGKYVYIRFLRDRGILSEEWLEENNINLDTVLGRSATLAGLLHLTETLEERFNGAIFPLPSNIEGIENIDKIVALVASTFKGDDPISGQLHLDFEAYNFFYIPVETLSSIYEQFLRTQGTGKKVGAVYTPEPVADYLLCELQESMPLQRGMKILDPCCGSGIFLVLAYRRLIELELVHRATDKLKPSELLRILCESIYGIERNKEACYVAEFSLILTLLNYIEPPDLHRNKQFKFPPLHNTQISECDFFDDESNFWKQGRKFDWIIGNPPWIELKPKTIGEELARSWIRKNAEERPATGNRVCEAFSWRVVDLLALDGYVGLLIHAKSLFNHESEKYRKLFFSQHEVARVTNFSNLAYVLFGGRGEAPAATITYRKLSSHEEDKRPIVHYGPFVVNQTPNRPWESNKKLPTWSLTINENEIQIVSSEEAKLGDAFTWKLALWGSYRDTKVIQRLKRLFKTTLGQLSEEKGWSLCQGLQLRTNLGDSVTESASYLLGMHLLDVKKLSGYSSGHSYRFNIPSNALRPIQTTVCFIRRRGGKAGLSLIKAPHLIFNPAYIIFSDLDFIIPDPQIGLSASEKDADYLRALSVFLSSSISQYYLFFRSPQWGVDRNRIFLKDVKEIPIPSFSKEQIFELAALQKNLANSEILKLNTNLNLQENLDREIERIIELPQSISIAVRDFTQIRIQLNKGKAAVSATKPPGEEHLYSYGICLRDELDDFTKGSGLKHKVILINSRDLIVCSVEFVQSDKPIDVNIEKSQGNPSTFFSYIQEKTKQRFSQWMYVQRSLRIFEDSKVYIFKASRLIDWTRTQALNDSDDVIAEILSANRELHRVVR